MKLSLIFTLSTISAICLFSSAFVPLSLTKAPAISKVNVARGNVLHIQKYSRVPPLFEASSDAAPVTPNVQVPSKEKSSMKETLTVGAYFALWYILNIGYNIYNKKVLNVFPMPWVVGTAQMAIGLLYFVPLWLTGLRKKPKLSFDNVKALIPIAAMHTGSHICAVLSLGAGAVSFTHIVKAAEPLFTSACGALFMNEFFAWQVYATLIPVVVGVGLASLKELSFSWIAFGNAMGSNLASALRGTFSKGLMGKPQGENMNAVNLYAVLTTLAFIILLPLAAIIEGPKLAATWAAAGKQVASKTIALELLYSGLFYYTYNEVAFLALDSVNPVTHAVGNTIKRVVVILASVIFFGTKMTPLGTFGTALAIGGVLLYSLAKNAFKTKK